MRWFEQQLDRSKKIKKLLTIADEFAYTLIDPPYFINYDAFRAEQPTMDSLRWIKLTDPKGQVNVLRPDLTTSVMQKLKWRKSDGPLKVCYNASTFTQSFQGFNDAKEFGYEYFNAPLKSGETILRNTLDRVIAGLSLDAVIECSHRGLLTVLTDIADISEDEQPVFRDLLNQKAWGDLTQWLTGRKTKALVQSFIETVSNYQGDLIGFTDLLNASEYAPMFKSIIEELLAFDSQTSNAVVIDGSMVDGWMYYVGLTFNVYDASVPEAIIRGGRYQVSNSNIEAIGFSVQLDALKGGQS